MPSLQSKKTYKISFEGPTKGQNDDKWIFCIEDKKAFYSKNGTDNITDSARLMEFNDCLYIQYEYNKAYELIGPKNLKRYKMWLAEQILEKEVFYES